MKRRRLSREKLREKAAKLAPPEEHPLKDADGHGVQHGNAGNGDGSIIVDTGMLNLPKSLEGEDEDGWRVLGLEPVVFAILVLALAFIAFIAYLISIEK